MRNLRSTIILIQLSVAICVGQTKHCLRVLTQISQKTLMECQLLKILTPHSLTYPSEFSALTKFEKRPDTLGGRCANPDESRRHLGLPKNDNPITCVLRGHVKKFEAFRARLRRWCRKRRWMN